jgi:hypothetical protein
VSPQNGFLPSEFPLEILPDAYYRPWETVARSFQSLILAKRFRQIIDALPVLSTEFLLTEAEWRRAYSVLAFMAHAYVWGGDRPADVSHQYPRMYADITLTHRRSFRHPCRSRSCRHANTLNCRQSLHTPVFAYGIGDQSSTENLLTRSRTSRRT